MQTETKSNIIKSELSPDGKQYGQSASNKIGFYGATPVVQSTTVATSVASTASTTSIQTSLNSLIVALSAALGGNGLIA